MRRELGIFSSSFIGGRFVVCVSLPFSVFVVLPHVHTQRVFCRATLQRQRTLPYEFTQ